MTFTRREHLKGLLTIAASASIRSSATAAAAIDPPVPPEGIGHKIRHLSYSDQGGRPDGVQVMVNRGHVYVGHMFSDGVTILDAADPRSLSRSVSSPPASTPVRIICRSRTIYCCSPTARTSSQCN